MLEDKLNIKFYEHYKGSFLEPVVILMREETLYDLKNEISKYVNVDFHNTKPPFKYRGVRIFRTPDMEIGEFIVK